MGTAASVDFLLLSAIWGASFMFIDMAALEFGPVPTAALRVGIAALMLLPLLLRRGLGRELLRHWKPLLVVGLLNSGIPFALYGFAVLSIPTGVSAVLNATTPLFGALVAWIWLSDRLDVSRIAGLVLGFAGVALLAWQRVAPDAGNAAASLPALLTAGGSQIGAAAGLALPALLTWPAQLPGLRAWLAVLTLGVMCTAFAYLLFFRLIEKAGPSRTLTVTYPLARATLAQRDLSVRPRDVPPTLPRGETVWSGRRDLNAGPPGPEPGALPGCATPRPQGPANGSKGGWRAQ